MKNYFIPNKENDYNPKIFQPKKLLVLFFAALVIAGASSIGNIVLKESGLLAAIESAFLVDLANEDRAKEHVSTLAINPILVEAAQQKANDMAEKGYFAHTSPEGRTPWYWFGQVKYDYIYAGENLAVNFTDSVDVHRAWLNSPSHKRNILDKRFTEIGIATAQGFYKGRKATFVVQMFGKPRSSAVTASVAVNTVPITVSGPDTQTTTQQVEVQGAQSSHDEVLPFVAHTNILERILVSPLSVGELILTIGVAILALTLLIRFFIEFRKRHIRHSVLLLVLILGLLVVLYTQREVLFDHVVLDPEAQETTNN